MIWRNISFCSLVVCLLLQGCGLKNPRPSEKSLGDVAVITESVSQTIVKNEDGPLSVVYEGSDTANVLIIAKPEDQTEPPQKDEPEPLKKLLEPQVQKQETAVSRMRPDAIREAAQLATFQKAIAWRYGQLLERTEIYANILDTVFNFSPLLMTQGQALIMPPMLAKGGASMRIEDNDTASTSKATYELLEPAKYISSPPTWREFLMVDNFPKPEEPNPALLPRTSAERAIWRKAVRNAWQEGITQADQLYADNVARMTREYRGIMLYHLLTAQHLLSKFNTASSDLGRHISGNKLNIGQQVYRITRPSSFIPASVPKQVASRRNRK